ncbi:MAG TPA: arylamine N-acetyltransferase, partial [Gemmataceae bacterium]|nr:arylamine N-acetyltransferase [Gemmataceae bacterium]
GWPVKLDPASLEQKLVRNGRGGYCYEHNLLFRHVLETLGYRAVGLAARVLLNVPEGMVRPKTHVLLLVEVGVQTYLTDVGFGGQTPTAPLRLESIIEQATPHGSFRLLPAGDEFVLESDFKGSWKPLYRFDLREQHLVDYEVANWYVSTHPGSHFLSALLAARPAAGRRYGLCDNELSIHTVGGSTEKRVISSAAELRSVLTDLFRLTLPAARGLDVVLERIAAKPTPAA